MKTIYKKELRAKEYLDSLGIENFIPMQQQVTSKYGRKKVILKPAVHNLIFVRTDLTQLREIKSNLNFLYNILQTTNDISTPIIVPKVQMDQFIDAINNHLDDIVYVDIMETTLVKGTPVKIIGGKFEGYTGELVKIKGKRDRRVHVSINGIAAYTFEVEACFVEKI